MSDTNELLKACYIQDVETEYVGKIESLSTAGDNIISNDCSCVVRGAFVTDDGNIVKKSLHSSTVKIINQDIFEESIESIMALLNAKLHKLHKFCYGPNEDECSEKNEIHSEYADSHFCHIFDRWQEIIESLRDTLDSESEYEVLIKPLEIQTVGNNCIDPSVDISVIVPEEVDKQLYEDKYKKILIQAIHSVIGLSCEDIFFVTNSEMEAFYKQCKEEED